MKHDIIHSQYLELLGNIGDVESYHILNELRRYVDRFLSESTQVEKFYDWRLFSSIIETSAENCPEFSGKLAAQCFDSLEKIAKNIILFKWRRTNEYSTISKQTPFYLSKLTKTLIGFEKIFERLGYRVVDDGDVWKFNINDYSAELFVKIAVDCFVANIECQIIQTIRTLTKDENISWSSIVKCRSNTTGSAEFCQKLLLSGKDNRFRSTKNNINENVNLIDIDDPTNALRVLNRKPSFAGRSTNENNVQSRKPTTKWYTDDSKSNSKWYDDDDSHSGGGTLPRAATSFEKNNPTKDSLPRPSSFHSTASTTSRDQKIVRLPKINAQNANNNFVSKKFPTSLHSKTSPKTTAVESVNSPIGLNSYLNKIQPTLNNLNERIKGIRDDAAAGVGVSSPNLNLEDGRECPKCRMRNRQKNIIICAFCSYYFPV